MMNGKKGCLSLLFLILSVAAYAADVRVSATVDRTLLPLGEELELTLSVQGSDTEEITPPKMDDFEVVSKSTSFQTTIINFKMSASRNTIFTLVPKRVGMLTIPEFVVMAGGTRYRTRPLQVSVIGSSGKSSISGNNSPTYDPRTTDSAQPRAFIRSLASAHSAYVGEQITFGYDLYYDRNAYGDVPETDNLALPDFGGFEVVEVKPSESDTKEVSIRGVSYQKVPIRRYLLYPIFMPPTGKGVIQPASLVVSESRNLFNDFFSMGLFQKNRVRHTPTLHLHSDTFELAIKPLPPNSGSANFSGAIGSFTVAGNLADDQPTKTGSAATLVVSVEGNGRVLKAPVLNLPDGLEAYDPTIRKSYTVEGNTLIERKEFTYLIVPQKPGNYPLNRVQYTFFDPKKESYQTANLALLTLTAIGDEIGQKTQASSSQPLSITKAAGFIKPNLTTLAVTQPYKVFVWCLGVQCLLLLIVLIFWQIQAQRHRMAQNPVEFRRRTALKKALGILYAKKGKPARQIEEALLSYVADRYGFPSPTGLTVPEIEMGFKTSAVSKDNQKQYFELKAECESALWGSSKTAESAWNSKLKEAGALLKNLERKSRSRGPGVSLFLIALLQISSIEATPVDDYNKANDLYAKKEYTKALELYLNTSRAGVNHPYLLHNLALSYYQTGDLGHAIVMMERASKLDANDGDIRHNLDFFREAIPISIAKPQSENMLARFVVLCTEFNPATLIIFQTIILFFLAILLTLKFACGHSLFSRHPLNPWVGSVLGLYLMASILLTYNIVRERRTQSAVIIKSTLSLRSGPGDDQTELFSLPAGIKLDLIRQKDNWWQVRIIGYAGHQSLDGLYGWVDQSGIEGI